MGPTFTDDRQQGKRHGGADGEEKVLPGAGRANPLPLPLFNLYLLGQGEVACLQIWLNHMHVGGPELWGFIM